MRNLPLNGNASLRLLADNCVIFSLNGKLQKVNGGLPGNTTLLQYIRDVAQLKGTKFMCREGGCGACIVNITLTDPVTHIEKSFSINSCLFALYSCHGMSVTTVEGIGNQQKGYHPVQTRLANFYGTQCGFCSPGWVMAMYSLLKSNQKLTMEQIENSFGSNNCRCTGYRPILDAFKSFAEDSSCDLKNKLIDIEDLLQHNNGKSNPNCKLYFKEPSSVESDESEEDDLERHFVELALASPSVCIPTAGKTTWYRVTTVQEIFEIFTMITGSYILLAGNTAQGIYETKYPPPADSYIDINGVSELRSHMFVSGSLVLGANITLTDTIQLFSAVAVEQPVSFGYLQVLVNHMNKVAHIPVRNVGTLAGNLSSKHNCPRFPSDLFTIFETVGAVLVINSGNGEKQWISLTEYLKTNMYKRIIKNIIFKPLDSSYVVKTYKVTRRAQNDHAVVNAGFCFHVDKTNNYRVIETPRIIYGGIRPNFIHASSTEDYLKGKCLLHKGTLQKVLSILSLEVNPDRQLPEASIEYRKGLALALFYRFVLSLNPSEVNPRLVSGGEEMSRPLSSGHQEYVSHPEQYPLTQPIPKLESLIQCSGEIQYTNDIPPVENELYAALVLADCGPATLYQIDASAALSIPGVEAFFSAKDIPGQNTYLDINLPFVVEFIELFACEKIRYAGQCVGVILAISQDLADFAAVRVVIKSRSTRRPVLSIKDVLKARETQRIKPVANIEPSTKRGDIYYTIKGDFSTEGQAHFYYETLSCLVNPVDKYSLDITTSTQCASSLLEAVSKLLNISSNRIYVRVQRCGGAFGGKITNSLLPACACALAAFLTQRPVRIVMNLQSNLRCLGGRYLSYTEYEVGVNGKGVIQFLNAQCYIDQGISLNDSLTALNTLQTFKNVYDPSTWSVCFYDVLTDKPSTVAARAPGSFESVGTIEHIMQHIASTVKMDLMDVRLNNLQKGSLIPQYWIELREKSNWDQRLEKCRNFNTNNQWKKRGLSVVPMLFRVDYIGVYHAMIAIYRNDGTVAISHGGSELGQGINTKVAQVAAYELDIPLSYIQVKATNTLTSPNNTYTASSSTTDGVCFAVRNCCQQINKRLGPLRNELGSGVTWPALIQAAFRANIDLYATYMFVPERDLKDYSVYGLTALEAEIDCLTGEHKIIRVDLLQNSGKSLNPFIDIGQVEGAFLMGLGNYKSEELIYDPKTGFLTTDRTWEYKIPGAKDIPVVWKIYLKERPNNPPVGTYGSRSVSEAPTVMSVVITFAFRLAIESLRQDIGLPDKFICYDSTWTAENIFLRCCANPRDYVL